MQMRLSLINTRNLIKPSFYRENIFTKRFVPTNTFTQHIIIQDVSILSVISCYNTVHKLTNQERVECKRILVLRHKRPLDYGNLLPQ